MNLRIVSAFFVCLGFVVPLAPAAAEQRVALVIGNGAYENAAELSNTRNDAADITEALKAVGFDVTEGTDLTKTAMDSKIREFADTLSGADAAVFYYAGHALQVGGVNYLVPVDAQVKTSASLDWEMVRLDLVQRTMEREAETTFCSSTPVETIRLLATSLAPWVRAPAKSGADWPRRSRASVRLSATRLSRGMWRSTEQAATRRTQAHSSRTFLYRANLSLQSSSTSGTT